MRLGERKAELRSLALARRDALAPEYREWASVEIAHRLLSLRQDMPPGPISLFWPIRSEIDTRPLMETLATLGHELALPLVTGRHLSFRAFAPGDVLVGGRFGLSEPHVSAREILPTTMLVPLAAFDRKGDRIGYGAGFYDRAIAQLSGDATPLTIGLAFAIQEIPDVPVEEHDRALDFVVTEKDVFVCRKDRN